MSKKIKNVSQEKLSTEQLFRLKVQKIIAGESTTSIDRKINTKRSQEKQTQKQELSETKKKHARKQKELKRTWNAGPSSSWELIVKKYPHLGGFEQVLGEYKTVLAVMKQLNEPKVHHTAYLAGISLSSAVVIMDSYGGWTIMYNIKSFDTPQLFINSVTIDSYSCYGYSSGHGYVPGDPYPGKENAVLELIESMIRYMITLKEKNSQQTTL